MLRHLLETGCAREKIGQAELLAPAVVRDRPTIKIAINQDGALVSASARRAAERAETVPPAE